MCLCSDTVKHLISYFEKVTYWTFYVFAHLLLGHWTLSSSVKFSRLGSGSWVKVQEPREALSTLTLTLWSAGRIATSSPMFNDEQKQPQTIFSISSYNSLNNSSVLAALGLPYLLCTSDKEVACFCQSNSFATLGKYQDGHRNTNYSMSGSTRCLRNTVKNQSQRFSCKVNEWKKCISLLTKLLPTLPNHKSICHQFIYEWD